MKKKSIGWGIILAIVLAFLLMPVVSEAGGLKKSPAKKVDKKVIQPKKEKIEVKSQAKVKQKKPSPVFASRQLVIGSEETYMAERGLKHSRFPQGDIQFESAQHLGTLSYELCDGLTLKGKIGAAQIKNANWGYGRHDYELAWGAGGEVDVLKCVNKCFPARGSSSLYGLNLIIKGEYFSIGSDKETSSSGSSLEEDWQEWNTSIILTKECGVFTPYIGARLSWAEVKAKLDYNISGVENFNGTLKADDHIGAIIGVDSNFSKCPKLGKIPFVKDLSAKIEVRAFDELAFTGGLNYTWRF